MVTQRKALYAQSFFFRYLCLTDLNAGALLASYDGGSGMSNPSGNCMLPSNVAHGINYPGTHIECSPGSNALLVALKIIEQANAIPFD